VYLRRGRDRLRGRAEYPLGLVLLEVAGTLVGPVAWLRSRGRVRRLGRSASMISTASNDSQAGTVSSLLR